MGRDFNWSNYRRLFDISILHAVAQREDVIVEELYGTGSTGRLLFTLDIISITHTKCCIPFYIRIAFGMCLLSKHKVARLQ